MILPLDQIKTACEQWDIALSPQMLEQMDRFAALLLEWNEKMNLTAITDPRDMAVKHFCDSLTLLASVSLPQRAKVLDVGSGAGFPAMPLLIARPDLKITMLDSLQKRLTFLQEALDLLGLKAELVHLRAEEGGKIPRFREQFDLVTARAVASLPVLCEYCMPYQRVGGLFAAMKGPDAEAELTSAASAAKQLGCKFLKKYPYQLPDGSKRTILLYEKVEFTPTKFPRIGGKIAKKPL